MVLKTLAWVLVAFCFLAAALGRGAMEQKSWNGFSMVLSFGLTAAFFLRGRVDDERVHSLKLKALGAAFLATYLLALKFQPHWPRMKPAPAMPATAYDFISATMLLALILFYFWRWQDARPAKDAE